MTAKLKDTRTNEFKQQVWDYLLAAIYGYPVDLPQTERAKARYLKNKYNNEFNNEYNQQQYPMNHNRVAEWLMGLPLNIDYTYHDIIQTTSLWHGIEPDDLSDNQVTQLTDRWFHFLAMKLIQFWEKHAITIH